MNIYKKKRVASIEDKIRKNWLCWFGYIQQRSLDASVKKSNLLIVHNNNRDRGRSKIIWTEIWIWWYATRSCTLWTGDGLILKTYWTTELKLGSSLFTLLAHYFTLSTPSRLYLQSLIAYVINPTALCQS